MGYDIPNNDEGRGHVVLFLFEPYEKEQLTDSERTEIKRYVNLKLRDAIGAKIVVKFVNYTNMPTHAKNIYTKIISASGNLFTYVIQQMFAFKDYIDETYVFPSHYYYGIIRDYLPALYKGVAGIKSDKVTPNRTLMTSNNKVILVHEFGHALGAKHVTTAKDIMQKGGAADDTEEARTGFINSENLRKMKNYYTRGAKSVAIRLFNDAWYGADATFIPFNKNREEIFQSLPSGFVNSISSLKVHPNYVLDLSLQNGSYARYSYPKRNNNKQYIYFNDRFVGYRMFKRSVSTTPQLNKVYKIINVYSNKALSLWGWSFDNGTNIIQWGYNSTKNMQWKFERVGNHYIIKNYLTGKVVDATGTSAQNGQNILQWYSHGGSNQKWIIEVGNQDDTGVSTVYLKSVATGKVLQISNASSSNAVNVNQWTKITGNTRQLWRIEQEDPHLSH